MQRPDHHLAQLSRIALNPYQKPTCTKLTSLPFTPNSQNQQGNNDQWQDPNLAAAAYQRGAADAIEQMQKVGSVGDLQVLGDMNLVGDAGAGYDGGGGWLGWRFF